MRLGELTVGELYAADTREERGRGSSLVDPDVLTVVRYLGRAVARQPYLRLEIVRTAPAAWAQRTWIRRVTKRPAVVGTTVRPSYVEGAEIRSTAALLVAPWEGYEQAWAQQKAVLDARNRVRDRDRAASDARCDGLNERLQAAGLPITARTAAPSNDQPGWTPAGFVDPGAPLSEADLLRILDALEATAG